MEFVSEKALTKALKSLGFLTNNLLYMTRLLCRVLQGFVWEWGSLARQKEQGLFSLHRLRFESISVSLVM